MHLSALEMGRWFYSCKETVLQLLVVNDAIPTPFLQLSPFTPNPSHTHCPYP